MHRLNTYNKNYEYVTVHFFILSNKKERQKTGMFYFSTFIQIRTLKFFKLNGLRNNVWMKTISLASHGVTNPLPL